MTGGKRRKKREIFFISSTTRKRIEKNIGGTKRVKGVEREELSIFLSGQSG